MNHTKGPWTVEKVSYESTEEFIINSKTELDLARVYNIYVESENNAKLIAAAPELLEGLQMIVDKRGSVGWDSECCAMLAEVLIKKATK